MQVELVRSVRAALKSNSCIWTYFVSELQHTAYSDIKTLKKSRINLGNAWETFCQEYLRIKGYKAYRLGEASPELLSKYKLTKLDRGIDIIAFDPQGDPCAVQCKFRRKGKVSWRELSTFEALCARSGPWNRHIVMTNAPGVKREGRPQVCDMTMSSKTFSAMRRHEWEILAGFGSGHRLGGVSDSSPTSARLEYFSKI